MSASVFSYYHLPSFVYSLKGRGSEVQILPGGADAAAGGCDEDSANRKTVAELLSLNPHEDNVLINISPICTSICVTNSILANLLPSTLH